MNYAVRIEFEDGSSQPHSEHWSISDSAAEALRLADEMGLDGNSGRARWVSIYSDGELTISIGVIVGGLCPPESR
jgi:hypothetical protein